MALAPARTLDERLRDTRDHFDNDEDTWVSTADAHTPYLVPLSFLWDGEAFVISTVATSPTSRNLSVNGGVRLAFGGTRDVVLVEGTATLLTEDQVKDGAGDAFAAKTGWDPRTENGTYHFFSIAPRRIQAWREVNELAGRDLMKQGRWLG